MDEGDRRVRSSRGVVSLYHRSCSHIHSIDITIAPQPPRSCTLRLQLVPQPPDLAKPILTAPSNQDPTSPYSHLFPVLPFPFRPVQRSGPRRLAHLPGDHGHVLRPVPSSSPGRRDPRRDGPRPGGRVVHEPSIGVEDEAYRFLLFFHLSFREDLRDVGGERSP